MSFLASLTLRGRLIFGGALLFLALSAALGLYFAGKRDGKAREQVKQAQIDAQAVTEARSRDEAAHTAVAAATASSGAEIERGRDAAADADDPWRAATEAMKK